MTRSKSKRKTVSTQARARIERQKLVHKLPTLLPRAIKLLDLARSMNSGSLKIGEHVAEDLVKTMLAPSSRRKRTGDAVAKLIALLLSISIVALQSLISQGLFSF